MLRLVPAVPAPLLWAAFALFACCGMLAIFSPKSFSALSRCSNCWVDSGKWLATLDKRIDIDRYVLPFSRALGVGVILALGVFAWLYVKHAL